MGKKRKTKKSWIWEFSKKIVVTCSVLYVLGFFFSMGIMYYFQDFSYMPTFIEQSTDVLKVCVFGYMVKAGVENAIKIKAGTVNTDEQGRG